ncbi:MAG: hypothetical protein HOV83_06055 [Catenulispora sp.]|nr:hypothetical protein [Catenulispora sp.]
MDFSGQLIELQQHAAAATDAAQAASRESRDQLKMRLDQAQAALSAGQKDPGQDTGKSGSDAKSRWNKMKADMSAHHKDVKMRMDKMSGQVDATLAEADAEWAEDDAAAAIAYAEWVVDNARYAVLNAIDARATADGLAKSSK